MGTVRRRMRVVEALALLLVAGVLRRYVPMRRWSRLLGATAPAAAPLELGPLSGVELLVARAVASGARRTGSNCLEQAVAASLMLRVRRQPGVVVIGLDARDPSAVPHAWLVGRSGRVVVGGEEAGAFRPVNQFGQLPSARRTP